MIIVKTRNISAQTTATLEYDKKGLCNNSNVKYSEIRFNNLLYFTQTLRK